MALHVEGTSRAAVDGSDFHSCVAAVLALVGNPGACKLDRGRARHGLCERASLHCHLLGRLAMEACCLRTPYRKSRDMCWSRQLTHGHGAGPGQGNGTALLEGCRVLRASLAVALHECATVCIRCCAQQGRWRSSLPNARASARANTLERTHARTHARTHTRLHAQADERTDGRAHARTHAHECTNVRTDGCTRTHTHAHAKARSLPPPAALYIARVRRRPDFGPFVALGAAWSDCSFLLHEVLDGQTWLSAPIVAVCLWGRSSLVYRPIDGAWVSGFEH